MSDKDDTNTENNEDLRPLTSADDSAEFEQAVLKDPEGEEYIRSLNEDELTD